MKHIYNTNPAAHTQRPAAKVLGTTISGKIFTVLLLSFFLLVGGESSGQTKTLYEPNGFASSSGLTLTSTIANSQGVLELANISGNNVLRARSTTGNGYNRIAVINESLQLKEGYVYNVSFRARSIEKEGIIFILRGTLGANSTYTTNLSEPLNSINIPISDDLNQYTISFRANLTESTNLALRFYLSQGNKHELLIDDLTITELCSANAPQVNSAGTCQTSARLTLKATGSPSGGTYRWYIDDKLTTYPIANQIGAEFTTPTLTQTTTYYVSYVNSAGCESVRVPVTAFIAKLTKPTVTSNANCDERGQRNITFTASGAASDEDYIWYNSTGGEAGRGGTITRNTNTTGHPGVYYVIKVKKADENCKSDPEALVMPSNNPTPSTPATIEETHCVGSTVVLQPTPEPGMTYRWYDANDNYLSEGLTFTIARVSSGITTYYYRKLSTATGCISARGAIIFNATQNALVPSKIGGLEAVCQGSRTITYNVPNVSGATYTWALTANAGSSGATFTGQGTNTVTVSYPNSAYVGKISVTVRNNCSEYSTSLDVQATYSNIATGEIIEPPVLALDQPAVFKFTTNIPSEEEEIERVQWFVRRVGSTTWETGAITRDWRIEKMEGNIDGFRVAIRVKDPNKFCFSSLSSSTGNLGINGFEANSFYIDDLPITPLPVELISFKAQRHTKGVNLTWATASELDNKGFEVQVSSDSKTFQSIGFVESKVGTTSIKQDYSFLDTKAVSGTRYYRLKQIDFDGTSSFSAVRAVSLGNGGGAVTAYPNPFDDVVIVTLNGTEARQVRTILTNAMGKVLMEQNEETAGNSITVNMAGISTKGLYMLHVLDGDTKHTFKLIKK